MASGGPASTPLGALGEGPPRTWTPLRALTPRDARRFELETRPSQRRWFQIAYAGLAHLPVALRPPKGEWTTQGTSSGYPTSPVKN